MPFQGSTVALQYSQGLGCAQNPNMVAHYQCTPCTRLTTVGLPLRRGLLLAEMSTAGALVRGIYTGDAV